MNNVDYYNKNADAFFEGSINADMSEARGKFTALLPKGAKLPMANFLRKRRASSLKSGFLILPTTGVTAMISMRCGMTKRPQGARRR